MVKGHQKLQLVVACIVVVEGTVGPAVAAAAVLVVAAAVVGVTAAVVAVAGVTVAVVVVAVVVVEAVDSCDPFEPAVDPTLVAVEIAVDLAY